MIFNQLIVVEAEPVSDKEIYTQKTEIQRVEEETKALIKQKTSIETMVEQDMKLFNMYLTLEQTKLQKDVLNMPNLLDKLTNVQLNQQEESAIKSLTINELREIKTVATKIIVHEILDLTHMVENFADIVPEIPEAPTREEYNNIIKKMAELEKEAAKIKKFGDACKKALALKKYDKWMVVFVVEAWYEYTEKKHPKYDLVRTIASV